MIVGLGVDAFDTVPTEAETRPAGAGFTRQISTAEDASCCGHHRSTARERRARFAGQDSPALGASPSGPHRIAPTARIERIAACVGVTHVLVSARVCRAAVTLLLESQP
jgi:hypothetical protein